MEVPVWVGGVQKWVTQVNRRTTCNDVIKALVNASEDKSGEDGFRQFVLVERWRKMERPLDGHCRILKVWRRWGGEEGRSVGGGEVRFALKRSTPRDVKRTQRRRHELTLERLVHKIVVQGETIKEQLRMLGDRETLINNYEQQTHRQRVEQIGANYLLDSYLDHVDAQGDAQVDPVDRDVVNILESLVALYVRLEEEESHLVCLEATLNHERQLEDSSIVDPISRQLKRVTDANATLASQLARNERKLCQLRTQLNGKRELAGKLERQLEETASNVVAINTLDTLV